MDVVWLILDALSFEATPFADEGPGNMPKLEAIAEQHGLIFTNAYAPGTASPSSHASMFTGELPSRSGMHEASPYFDSDILTIGDVLGTQRESFIISHNPFIFNGLQRGFSRTDDLRASQYMLFEDGTDPHQFLVEHRDTPVPHRYLEFLRHGENPIRSLLNGVNYKVQSWMTDLGQQSEISSTSVSYQYADQMNKKMRDFLDKTERDAFVVANYMDIHPPLDASDEALQRFAPDTPREKLPIGATSPEIIEQSEQGNSTITSNAESLYNAAIWDTDQLIGPLVEELIESGTFVIVTADHGTRFTNVHPLSDRRIHVPLLIFAPDISPRIVDQSVNLRSLPATTMARIDPEDDSFDGYDLLSVTEDQTSITEYIYDSSPTGNSVSAFGAFDEVQYDLTGIKNDTRVNWINGAFDELGDSMTERELAEVITDLSDRGVAESRESIKYHKETEERLESLGYL